MADNGKLTKNLRTGIGVILVFTAVAGVYFLTPFFPCGYHVNLACICESAGKPEAAFESYRRAYDIRRSAKIGKRLAAAAVKVGMRKIENGLYDRADEILRIGIGAGENRELRLLKIALHIREGAPEKARDSATFVGDGSFPNTEWLIPAMAAFLDILDGTPDQVESRLAEAVRKAPFQGRPFLLAGDACWISGDYSDAGDWYLRALETDPDDPLAWLRYGTWTRHIDEDLTEAIELFRRGLKLPVQNPELEWALAEALEAAGRSAEAEKRALLAALRKVTLWETRYIRLIAAHDPLLVSEPQMRGHLIPEQILKRIPSP